MRCSDGADRRPKTGDLCDAGHRSGSQETAMSDTQPKAKKTAKVLEPHQITHHAVCLDCPEEWLGGKKVHYQAEQHALCRGHRTTAVRVDSE